MDRSLYYKDTCILCYVCTNRKIKQIFADFGPYSHHISSPRCPTQIPKKPTSPYASLPRCLCFMWLEHCLLWRTSERHFMCGPQLKAIHCGSWCIATLKTLGFFCEKLKHLQSINVGMVWFPCYIFGGVAGSSIPMEIQTEVKSLHGSFTLNMRCMQLQHYLEHWFAWACYVVVPKLGFLIEGWLSRVKPLQGEPFHLHNPNRNKDPTILSCLKLNGSSTSRFNPTSITGPRTDLWMLRECFWVPGQSSSWEW